jgi:hypothetical protein
LGAVLFAGAFFVVVAVLAWRGGRRRWRSLRQVDRHVVASHRDIEAVVGRVKCACGRWPDRDGEGPRDGGAWGVELSCVCGRRRSLVFIVGN